MLQLFDDLLTDVGCAVSVQRYGHQGMEDVLAVSPDLIIADVLPMDRAQQGWQFVSRLKQEPATAQIPLIVCTTNVRALREHQAWLTHQGVPVVTKPFQVDALMGVIARLLGTADALSRGRTTGTMN